MENSSCPLKTVIFISTHKLDLNHGLSYISVGFISSWFPNIETWNIHTFNEKYCYIDQDLKHTFSGTYFPQIKMLSNKSIPKENYKLPSILFFVHNQYRHHDLVGKINPLPKWYFRFWIFAHEKKTKWCRDV